MNGDGQSRRAVLKAGGALAALGVMGSLSGCTDGTGLLDGDDSGFSTAVIPDGVDGLAHLNMATLLEDEAIRSAANTVISGQQLEDVDTIDEAFDEIEADVGIDPEGINDIAGFGDDSAEDAGVVFWTEYDSTELLEVIEEEADEEIERDTYEGQLLFRVDGEPVAELDDGVFVAGDESMVFRVVDTWRGEHESISGPALEAFEGTEDGYVRFGVEVPAEADEEVPPEFQGVEQVSGSLFADGDERVVELTTGTDSEETAAELEEALDELVESLERAAEEGNPFVTEEILEEVQERVAYEADGADLNVAYRASAEDFSDFIGEAIGEMVLDILGVQSDFDE